QPEQQVEIRPENGAVHTLGHVEHVMVIVPVDAQVDEAEQIREERGQYRAERAPVGAVWCAQLEHHDRDDDGDHGVAEGFEAGSTHWAKLECFRLAANGWLTARG